MDRFFYNINGSPLLLSHRQGVSASGRTDLQEHFDNLRAPQQASQSAPPVPAWMAQSPTLSRLIETGGKTCTMKSVAEGKQCRSAVEEVRRIIEAKLGVAVAASFAQDAKELVDGVTYRKISLDEALDGMVARAELCRQNAPKPMQRPSGLPPITGRLTTMEAFGGGPVSYYR